MKRILTLIILVFITQNALADQASEINILKNDNFSIVLVEDDQLDGGDLFFRNEAGFERRLSFWSKPAIPFDQAFFISENNNNLLYVNPDMNGMELYYYNIKNNELFELSEYIKEKYNKQKALYFGLPNKFNEEKNQLLIDINFEEEASFFCVFDLTKIDNQEADFISCPFDNVLNQKIEAGELDSWCKNNFSCLGEEISDSKWTDSNTIEFKSKVPSSDIDQYEVFEVSVDGDKMMQTGTYPPSPFSDLEETDKNYDEVLRAMNDGWLEGYPDGTVRLDQPINRAEFAKVVIKALAPWEGQDPFMKKGIELLSVPDDVTAICPDVPTGEWYSDVFYTAKKLGAIQGYPQEGVDSSKWLCKPDQNINKVEALKVILELAGWYKDIASEESYLNQYSDTKSSESEWFWYYTGFAKSKELMQVSDNDRLNPGDPISRRDMIYLTNRVREEFNWK